MPKKLFALLPLLSLCVFSCSKNRTTEESDLRPAAPVQISLEEILAPEGCISLPRYFQELKKLNPDLSLLTVTQDMDFKAKKKLRPEFVELASFGGFKFEQSRLANLQYLDSVSQDGCASFALAEEEERYQIKESTRTLLRGITESGREISYEFLSGNRMRVAIRNITYDLPCGTEENPILGRTTQVFDWNGSIPDKIEETSELAINRDYLTKVAEATGHNLAELYQTETAEDGSTREVLVTDQLRQVSQWQPRSELLSCRAEEPPPPDEGGHDGNFF